jgi:hypothetical protein
MAQRRKASHRCRMRAVVVDHGEARWSRWRPEFAEWGLELKMLAHLNTTLDAVDQPAVVLIAGERGCMRPSKARSVIRVLRGRASSCGIVLVSSRWRATAADADFALADSEPKLSALGEGLFHALFAAAGRSSDLGWRAELMTVAWDCLVISYARQMGAPPRERELLPHILRGRSNEFIQAAMRIKRGTVCTFKRRLLLRMSAHGHVEGLQFVFERLGCMDALSGSSGIEDPRSRLGTGDDVGDDRPAQRAAS